MSKPTAYGDTQEGKNASSALTGYVNAVNTNTGEAGYNKSTQMAKGVAQDMSAQQAGGAVAAAQSAARSSGMTKGQAAALGTQQGATTYSNSYANNFSNQQAQAANQLNNQTTALGNKANMLEEYGKTRASSEAAANNFGLNVVSSFLNPSDKRVKDAEKVEFDSLDKKFHPTFESVGERFSQKKESTK